MHFYTVLINKKIPSISLTYKSEVEIVKGALIVVLLRNNEVSGVVIGEVEESNIADPDKISLIKKVLPYSFSNQQLRLQNIISYNTFNSPNTVLDAFINPILGLTQKDFKLLEERVSNSTQNNITQPNKSKKIEYYLDTEVVLRIIYIIRISILGYLKAFINYNNEFKQKHINILILFPEKKYLEKIYKELIESAFEAEFLSDQVSINVTTFTGDKTKSNRRSLYNTLDLNKEKMTNINIILATRSGLFLPFDALHDILVIDESNSMYIQEQNSLYFDARELAFILSEVYGSNLHFISRVPSIRLHSFYPQTILNNYLTSNEVEIVKPLKIKITGQNRKIDKYKLISDSVLKLVQKNNDSEGLASEVVDQNFENWGD